MTMSLNVKQLLTKGLDAKGKGNFHYAREQFQMALVESRRVRDLQGEANALLELAGIALKFDNDLSTAREQLENCLQIYTRIRFARGIAYSMSDLGSVALMQGKKDDALSWLQRALTIFESEHDQYGKAATLHQIGLIDKLSGDWDSAERHWRQSLTIFEKLGNKAASGQVLLSLGNLSATYHQDLQQARLLLNRALMLFEELGLVHEAEKARHNLSLIPNEVD